MYDYDLERDVEAFGYVCEPDVEAPAVDEESFVEAGWMCEDFGEDIPCNGEDIFSLQDHASAQQEFGGTAY